MNIPHRKIEITPHDKRRAPYFTVTWLVDIWDLYETVGSESFIFTNTNMTWNPILLEPWHLQESKVSSLQDLRPLLWGSSGLCSAWSGMQHAFLVVYRRFRTAHQSHLQWANMKSEVLKMQSTEICGFM